MTTGKTIVLTTQTFVGKVMYLLFNMLFRLVIAFLFLKEIIPKYSLQRLMLKLKFQHFDHLMQRTDSLEKTLMLGKIEGGRRRGHRK